MCGRTACTVRRGGVGNGRWLRHVEVSTGGIGATAYGSYRANPLPDRYCCSVLASNGCSLSLVYGFAGILSPDDWSNKQMERGETVY